MTMVNLILKALIYACIYCVLQAMDGFLLVITADGTILYVSRNILHHLGFNQVNNQTTNHTTYIITKQGILSNVGLSYILR